MQEGQVLLDHWEEWDDGRLHALAAQDVAVLGHVPGWVEHILQVPKQLLVLAGQFFPGTPQTGHWCQVQTAVGGCGGADRKDEKGTILQGISLFLSFSSLLAILQLLPA